MLIKSIAKQILSGLAAGLLITIGCCVYLGCDTKWVGAILFSVALLSICIMNFSLFTGRVGFIVPEPSKEKFSALFLGLLGNVIATAVVGIAVQYAIPNLHDAAVIICEAKLVQQQLWQTLIRGILCGVLMYIAVGVYKSKKSIVGIIFCIPVFILSGFEHSIADMGYFAIAGIYSAKAFGFIWVVIIGNAIGALIIPLCKMLVADKKVESKEENGVQALADKQYTDELNAQAASDIVNDTSLQSAEVACEKDVKDEA